MCVWEKQFFLPMPEKGMTSLWTENHGGGFMEEEMHRGSSERRGAGIGGRALWEFRLAGCFDVGEEIEAASGS